MYVGIIRKLATRGYWAQGLIEGEFPIVTKIFCVGTGAANRKNILSLVSPWLQYWKGDNT